VVDLVEPLPSYFGKRERKSQKEEKLARHIKQTVPCPSSLLKVWNHY